MIYIIGDLHGNRQRLQDAIDSFENLDFGPNIVICAGDVGLEYGNEYMVRKYAKNEKKMKKMMQNSGYIWIIMRGNHDNCYYKDHVGQEGWVDVDHTLLYEAEFPHIFYIKDEGGVYMIEGLSFLMIPGAYSVDKYYRLEQGLSWNPDEQLTYDEENKLLDQLAKYSYNVDYIVTHTYPLGIENKVKYLFMNKVSQDQVDKQMERFLEMIDQTVDYKHWYFGHLHDDKEIDDKHTLLYNQCAMISQWRANER